MRLLLRLLFIVALLALCGCPGKFVEVEVLSPSELTISGVKNVAIGGFQMQGSVMRRLEGREGRWNETSYNPVDPRTVADLVRSELIGGLSRTPHYRVIDVALFRDLYSNEKILELTGKGSFAPYEADAVIFGDVWLGLTRVDGEAHEKVALENINFRGNSKLVTSEQQVYPVKVEQLSATLTVQFTVIRLRPVLEVITVDTVIKDFEASDMLSVVDNTVGLPGAGAVGQALGSLLGGGNENTQPEQKQPDEKSISAQSVLSDAEAVVTQLVQEATGSFVKRISLTRSKERIEVAAGGDPHAEAALAHGAKDYAVGLLLELVRNEPMEIDPAVAGANRYNLGLAYELKGPAFYQDAMLWYEEALNQVPESELFSKGLGRISRRVRSFSRAEYQRILTREAERK